MRRPEGDNAWDVQISTGRSTQQKPTIQQKDELESGRRAKKVYLRDRTFWTSKDVLQDAQVVLKRAAHRGVPSKNAVKLETSGNQEETVTEHDVSLKRRKIGEPEIDPGGASSSTADTPKRGESEQ